MTGPAFDILMYHSISEGPGPTSISPQTFREQLSALAERGYRGITLAELAGWLRGEGRPTDKAVVLTFDDGFTDFADVAFPELQARGWPATVFLPAGKAGEIADFDRWPGRAPRRLLSWHAVADLARAGAEIGSHSVSHPDLTALRLDDAREEIVESGRRIEDRIGRAVTSFAAPYGRTNAAIRALIRQHYRVAVSAELARARVTADPHHLPRIEMWYFSDLPKWQSYLDGGARGYFLLRQALRRLRKFVR
jgi:peptidoglycan/xylan/chitin deacetylase (PgdA/CDA1 family)